MDSINDRGLLDGTTDVFAFCADQPAPLSESVKLPIPGQGKFFDEHIDLRDPEGGLLTERLVEIFDKVRPRKRKRGRDALRLRLRRLAANALSAYFFRDIPAILYFRGAAVKDYTDKPDWMKHGAIGNVVDALIAAGLADGITGEKMPWNSKNPSTASSYWVTDELIRLAVECDVTSQSINQNVPADDLVQLFAPKMRAGFDPLKRELIHPRKGKRIRFEATVETNGWTTALAAINAFYRQHEITLGLAPDEIKDWLDKRNTYSEFRSPYRLPEMFATHIYRVFNNGVENNPTFDLGGRLFGGWWMYLSEDLRRVITIDDKPTVELDYAHCHPRMLYHQRGLDGDGELYTLPEVTAYEIATGVAASTYRPSIKWLVQILLNGRGRPGAVERPEWLKFPPDIPFNQMVQYVEAHHHLIADDFRTGEGLRLMRVESDIALEIVSTEMAEGWPVLPVHDSFITTTDKRDRLKSLMIDTYVQRLGKEPVIKEPLTE